MAIRKQTFDVTTSLPMANGRFQGSKEENLIRYSDRPAILLGYEFDADALTGFESFSVNELEIDDIVLASSIVDEVPGRTIFYYVNERVGRDTSESGPVFRVTNSPASNEPIAYPTLVNTDVLNDISETVNVLAPAAVAAALSRPVYFNTKALEVEVFGGMSATETINIILYYESAGDYRF